MAIRLIDDSERLSIDIDGTIFHYQRISPKVLRKLNNRLMYQQTVPGTKDTRTYVLVGDYNEAIAKKAIVGWENLENAKGVNIDFPSDEKSRNSIIEKLPNIVINKIVEASAKSATELVNDLKQKETETENF